MERLRRWAGAIKRDLGAAWLAVRDPQVPLAARLLCLAVVSYALSPIDLIPDFIPVLGLLDDMILVPAGIWLSIRMIPAGLLAGLREQAQRQALPGASLAGAAVVAALWLAGLAALWLWWTG